MEKFIISEKRRKVWDIQKELLLELDKICKKHHLKYFVDSGTLLGAVRHQGFIPWDDDIDVVMLREDYDQLIAECSDEFKGKFFLQSAYSDSGYFRGHAQLRNSETAAILEGEGEHVLFNQGIFIDIFPLDFHSKYQIIDIIYRWILNMNLKIFQIMFRNEKPQFNLKSFFRIIIKKIFLHFNYKKMYQKFEKRCKNIPFKSDILDKISFYSKIKMYDKIPLSAYRDSVLLEFDHIKVVAPKDYDVVLKKKYGEDYMIPKQVSTSHGRVYYSTDQSYRELLKNSQYKKKKFLL